MQKLVTKELERKTPKLYETDGQGKQAMAQARYFSLMGGLAGWEWYMTEYDPDTKQAFGLVKGFCSELGYFSIEEFEQMNQRAEGRACRLSSVTSRFSLASWRKLHRDRRPEMSNREQIIERIKKLLSHSVENGATEAEAVAFALKAQKLIADNDVEDWELGEDCKQEVVEVMTEKSYSRAWRSFLACVIADNFRCKAIQSGRYVGTSSRRKTFITFVGYECDAKAASIVFDHLYTVGNKLAKAHENRCYTEPDAYENFVRGFTQGVRDELEKQCQALMLVCPQDVEDYYNDMNLKAGRRPRLIWGSEHSQEAGRKAGREAVRSRRVEGGKPAYQLA